LTLPASPYMLSPSDAGTWPTAPHCALSRQLRHGALRFLQAPCRFHGDTDMCGTSHVMASPCSPSCIVNCGREKRIVCEGTRIGEGETSHRVRLSPTCPEASLSLGCWC